VNVQEEKKRGEVTDCLHIGGRKAHTDNTESERKNAQKREKGRKGGKGKGRRKQEAI